MLRLGDTCLSNRITYPNSGGDRCELYDSHQIRTYKVLQIIKMPTVTLIGSRLTLCGMDRHMLDRKSFQ